MNSLSTSKFNILAILPHSIGGRLTASSIIDGFVDNGFNVVVFDELKQQMQDFESIILKKSFDYIVGYNFSAIHLANKYNLNCKIINYFSDEIDKKQAGIGFENYIEFLNAPNVYTFYWDKTLCEKIKSQINNLFYLPHFINTNIYKPSIIKPKFDVMFAGRLDTDFRLDFWINLVKSMPNVRFAWYAIEKHYNDALSRLSSENSKLLTKTYQGFIDNEKDMALAINNAKIVINMHSQGVSSLNYRTFQVMSCEKLLLCDYREEIASLFNNKGLIVYKDLDDIKLKISHYLYNEVDYNEVIKNARAKICENHDAKSCVKKMIEFTQI